MDSLQEIMGRKKFVAPDEMGRIKAYIQKKWGGEATVQIERDTVILKVPSSALAAAIQMEKHQLIEACDLQKKKLVIRIGR